MRRSGIVSHIGMLAVVLAFSVLGSGGTPRLAATGQVIVRRHWPQQSARPPVPDPTGDLYVAEGGAGGGNTTDDLCEQVIGPVGPYRGISPHASPHPPAGYTTVVSGLPSSQTQSIPRAARERRGRRRVHRDDAIRSLPVADAHTESRTSRTASCASTRRHATWTQVTNLSDWSLNHPVANPEEGDFEPDGTCAA